MRKRPLALLKTAFCKGPGGQGVAPRVLMLRKDGCMMKIVLCLPSFIQCIYGKRQDSVRML